MHWSLNDLYEGINTEKFKKDFESLKSIIKQLKIFADEKLADSSNTEQKLVGFIELYTKFEKLILLKSYTQLILSVDSENDEANKFSSKFDEIFSELATPEAKFTKFVSEISNLDEIIEKSEALKPYTFRLNELKSKGKYMLSEKEEQAIAKMQTTSSKAWRRLWEHITSTLMVDITLDGKAQQLPLTMVRNMAQSDDGAVRKAAYEAELAAYEKIDKSAAHALNSIKAEVITVSKMRGYKSPLEQTLVSSRMSEQTLDALISAIKDNLNIFTKYYKKKAEMLGHKNGLPFYELFAPVSNAEFSFTYEEAQKFIVKNFSAFSKQFGDYAKKAFDNNWIDAEPKSGKVGGAFCSNLHSIGQSRILANFSGSVDNVLTLAHELGHGYHGEMLKEESALNSHYPMPLAETASIFAETIATNAAIKEASGEEALLILENSISSDAQVIVDIYSRFLFEKAVFEKREDGILSVAELKNIMLEAQKAAYGKGLDHNFLHPYMWVCKTHYYYANRNFYNFPYAFGNMFAKGLYSQYQKEGEAFVQKYNNLLAATGKNSVEDVAKMAGIDLTKKEFWESSLKLIEADIDKFCSL